MPVIPKSYLSVHIAFMGSLSSAYQELIVFLFLSSHLHLLCNIASVPSASSVQFSRSVMFDSLRTHGLQHARLPCPSLIPRACSNSCPLSWWCHPTISILCWPLLLLPSIFPSIRVFSSESVLCIRWPKYWSFSFASVLPMNIQDWLPLGWTGLTSLQSKRLSRSSPTPQSQKHHFFGTQLLYGPVLTSIHGILE